MRGTRADKVRRQLGPSGGVVWRAAAVAMLSLVALTLGCDDGCWGTCEDCDDQAPAVPTGVGSITGDTYVVVYWNPVHEEDLAGYGVYRSRNEEGPYSRLGDVDRGEATRFTDEDLTNGTTYYYAVDAYDYTGNESDLSYETVDDTPRPEGWELTWYTRQYKPLEAGIAILPDDYDTLVLMPYNSMGAQYYLMTDAGGCMRIVAWRDVHGFPNLIQDYGYTGHPDDVDNAPTEGWSSCADGVEVIVGHTYILKTSTGYYGKIRVEEMGSEGIIVYWAFQGKRGSTELAPVCGGGPKRG
jgi:hypothetical protein